MFLYEAFYGYAHPFLPSVSTELLIVGAVDEFLEKRQQLNNQLKMNLQLAQNRMKQIVDKKRTDWLTDWESLPWGIGFAWTYSFVGKLQ